MLPPLKLEEYVEIKKTKQNSPPTPCDGAIGEHLLNSSDRMTVPTLIVWTPSGHSWKLLTGYITADRRSLTLRIYSISHGYTYTWRNKNSQLRGIQPEVCFVVTWLKNYKERASRCEGSICFPFWLSDCDKSTTSPPDAVYVRQIKRAPPSCTVYPALV